MVFDKCSKEYQLFKETNIKSDLVMLINIKLKLNSKRIHGLLWLLQTRKDRGGEGRREWGAVHLCPESYFFCIIIYYIV